MDKVIVIPESFLVRRRHGSAWLTSIVVPRAGFSDRVLAYLIGLLNQSEPIATTQKTSCQSKGS
jgi:hypothetical protein